MKLISRTFPSVDIMPKTKVGIIKGLLEGILRIFLDFFFLKEVLAEMFDGTLG